MIEKILQSSEKPVEEIFTEKGKVYSFVNPVSYLLIRPYCRLYDDVDGLFADGSLMVFFIALFCGKKIHRYSFDMTSMAKMFFEFASKNGMSVYLIGSEQERIETSYKTIVEKYPNLKVVEYRNGYFANVEERQRVIQGIVNSQPDYVIAGMGAVVQDHFLVDLKKAGFKGVGFSCGGFFSQMAQKECIDYYPPWIDKLNMRFLYRMYKEPHTRCRYLKAFFQFPFEFIADLRKCV